MPYSINCPNCGGENSYTGEVKTIQCTFCGSAIPVPTEVVSEVATNKISKRMITWIIVLGIIIFVIPVCVGFGGAIIGFIATIFSAIVTVIASFLGH